MIFRDFTPPSGRPAEAARPPDRGTLALRRGCAQKWPDIGHKKRLSGVDIGEPNPAGTGGYQPPAGAGAATQPNECGV